MLDKRDEDTVYNTEFFRRKGKEGGLKGASHWEKLDEKARSKRAKKGWKTRRKLSTGKNK